VSTRLGLVTGATGYVGGRLLRELAARGERVRSLARRPEFLEPRVPPGTEVVRGDVLRPESLPAATAGVEVAHYLIHSMGSGGDFESEDRRAAHGFAAAARAAGVRRIVYLGGLGHEPGLSRHLRSRQEVGRILRESGVPTIELRASIVIGSGSLSFEMVRALVQKLPVVITPRWVSQPAQPLAIEDLVAYLVSAAEIELGASLVVEIGGADRRRHDRSRRHLQSRARRGREHSGPAPASSPRGRLEVPFLVPRAHGTARPGWLPLLQWRAASAHPGPSRSAAKAAWASPTSGS
jgi:uncharacterized protein YbjT (DUF2867 family)